MGGGDGVVCKCECTIVSMNGGVSWCDVNWYCVTQELYDTAIV